MLVVGTFMGQATGQCPNGENYLPCTCTYDAGYVVECYQALIDDVVNIFKRTTAAKLKTFRFTLSELDPSSSKNITIPSDLLNNHTVSYDIVLDCPVNKPYVEIDPDAFRSSKNLTQQFKLEYCEFYQFDFQFVEGFEKLSILSFSSIQNFNLANWMNIPALPSLSQLDIYQSKGLNEWTALPQLHSTGLTLLRIDRCELLDDSMNYILNWTVENSNQTLKTLNLIGNNLTIIPSQIPSFTSLESLDIHYEQSSGIAKIPTGALNFNSPVTNLIMSDDHIEIIEPGAFQGNLNIYLVLI